MSTIDIVC